MAEQRNVDQNKTRVRFSSELKSPRASSTATDETTTTQNSPGRKGSQQSSGKSTSGSSEDSLAFSPEQLSESSDEDLVDESQLSCELNGRNLKLLRDILSSSEHPQPTTTLTQPPQSITAATKPVKSSTSASEEELHRKLQKLDPEKQKYLLRVLESLEREESLAASSHVASSAQQADNTKMSVDLASSSRSASARARTVVFRALSTYGSQQLAGLCKIEVLDERQQRVKIPSSAISCDKPPVGESLSCLFNGSPLTLDDKEMFVCRITQQQSSQQSQRSSDRLFQVSFTLPRGAAVNQIKIWNYNSKFRDLNIGVKEAIVISGTKILWQGTLNRGSGNNISDTSTTVSIPLSVGGNLIPSNTISPSLTDPQNQNQQQQSQQSKLKAPLPRLPRLKKPLGGTEINPSKDKSPQSRSLNEKGRSSSEISLEIVAPVINPAPSPRRGSVGEKTGRIGDQPSWLNTGTSSLQRQASLDDEDLTSLSVRGDNQSTRKEKRPAESARRYGEGRSRHAPKQSKDSYIPSALQDTTHKSSKLDGTSILSTSLQTLSLTQNATPSVSPFGSPCPTPGISGSGNSNTNTPTNISRRSPSRFVYPSMPSGRVMVISMTSTWGDPYYIGLSGLDIFDDKGKIVKLADVSKQLRADPPDINILEGYEKDPRTIDKILDGVSRTCDDFHVWLAPFTEGRIHTITIEFNAKTTFSLLRFWNYNKSRIHSYRGAREMEIELDGVIIFKGEIKRAPGNLFSADACAEYILFSNDDNVLGAIEANDPIPPLIEDPLQPLPRPSTQGGDERIDEIGSLVGDGSRPMTQACRRPTQTHPNPKTVQLSPRNSGGSISSKTCPKVKKITFNFLETWGDPYYMGLTGIKFYDEELKPIVVDASQLTATPRDINELPNCSGDDRTLDKLVDGKQITTDDHHMWMIPFTPGQDHLLNIQFPEPRFVSCFRIWNYNKTRDDSYRGAKQVQISFDGMMVTPPTGITLRKAPGEACFDFGQTVDLTAISHAPDVKISKEISAIRDQRPREELRKQGYEISLLPCGFVFKFVFLTTWGDPFYIGLNGLELYDWHGEKLPISMENTEAVPRSINVLPDVKNDPRTLDKLFDGVNDTFNDMHMWLCPFIPGQANYLYIWFDQPVALGMIKLWNYSKTPSRGVEEFEVLVDDILVFKGFLKQSPSTAHQKGGNEPDFAQSVLFTNDEAMVAREKKHMFSISEEDQHVQFINNRQVMIPSSRRATALQSAKRPKTSVLGTNDEQQQQNQPPIQQQTTKP